MRNESREASMFKEFVLDKIENIETYSTKDINYLYFQFLKDNNFITYTTKFKNFPVSERLYYWDISALIEQLLDKYLLPETTEFFEDRNMAFDRALMIIKYNPNTVFETSERRYLSATNELKNELIKSLKLIKKWLKNGPYILIYGPFIGIT